MLEEVMENCSQKVIAMQDYMQFLRTQLSISDYPDRSCSFNQGGGEMSSGNRNLDSVTSMRLSIKELGKLGTSVEDQKMSESLRKAKMMSTQQPNVGKLIKLEDEKESIAPEKELKEGNSLIL